MFYLPRIAAGLLLAFLVCSEARAASSFYDVEVRVDVTDVNAAKAREKAMATANRKAFETVVGRLTTSRQASDLLGLSDQQLLNFIKEISVVSEKSSNVRYIADLLVTVNEDILKSYLSEKEVQTAVEASAKVTVIPVFHPFETDKPMLWEDENLWLKAWNERQSGNSPVSVTALKISSDISAEQAVVYDTEALESVRLNNNASDVYVLDAFYDGIDGLKIKMSSLKNADNAFETISVPGDKNQPEILFAQAVEAVSEHIENKIKEQNIAENQLLAGIDVVYDFSSLSDWVRTEKDVKSLPHVRDLSITAMTPGRVQFRLDYSGSDENISKELFSKGMVLKNYENIYQLER